MKITKLLSRQKGFTLIEIMIALLLGAFLIGGILQIFINSRATYRMQDSLSRLQENGRFAMEFIGRDLRMAGYSFCPRPADSIPNPLANFITGTNGNNNGAAQDGPDTISMLWLEGNDCPLVLPGARRTVIYDVVGRDLRRNTGGAGGPVPLIEGVENMQILYGIDTDTDTSGRGAPNYYGTASGLTAADLDDVVSVRVSLLLSSTEQFILDAPASVSFNNEQSASDRRLRRVFTSTFTLRNRHHVAGN